MRNIYSSFNSVGTTGGDGNVPPIPAHLTNVDLEAARLVQGRFFPRQLPPIEGLDYYGACQPSGAGGGDFFDFIRLDTSALIASLGEVSGNGIPAALLMTGLQASLRGFSAGGIARLSDVVREVNRLVCEISPDNLYTTLFYVHVDPRSHELRYVNAGHEPALLVRKGADRVQRLETTGTVLGLSDRSAYAQRTVGFNPGDVLVSFTDGITDAVDANGRELCEAGVLDVVRNHDAGDAADLVNRILEAVERFAYRSSEADDRTVVAIRCMDAMERPALEESRAELALAAA